MNRRQFLFSSTAAACKRCCERCSRAAPKHPGHSWPTISPHGCWDATETRRSRPPISTIWLAAVMRFANSFCATPICSASRATFFTGRLPRQHGIHDFLADQPIENPPQGQEAPPSSFRSEVMISDLLSKAGYNCGYVGKWHMGNDAQARTRIQIHVHDDRRLSGPTPIPR